jgi:uncharacterized protein (TIGR00645 family)
MAKLKSWFEHGLFATRWLMAPFYLGLVFALIGLLAVFVRELVHDVPALIASADADKAIVMALSLIDLSLAASLVLIVILSGYENFVSKLEVGGHPDRPDWLATVDFTGLKMKLIASVVVISAVALLKAFMDLAEPGAAPDPAKLGWMIGLHVTFLVSGVLLALMDWLQHRSEA